MTDIMELIRNTQSLHYTSKSLNYLLPKYEEHMAQLQSRIQAMQEVCNAAVKYEEYKMSGSELIDIIRKNKEGLK